MAQRKTLTATQVEVLRWIGDGCPAGVMDGVVHRISAAALRNHGFVRTSGRGPTWHAEITEPGTEYLRQVDGANPPTPRQPNVSVTELVNDLLAAGGVLRVPRKEWGQPGVDYEHRARLAQTYGKVPSGHRLAVTTLSRDGVQLELVPDAQLERDAEAATPGLAPISVPERVQKLHPLARQFRDQVALQEISRKELPRALRIVHALAAEAERRGYAIACVELAEDQYGRSEWSPARDGQLVFTIRGHGVRLRFYEKGCGRRGFYEKRMEEWRRDRTQPVRLMQFVHRPTPYETGATGQLEAEALGPSMGRQRTWGDRKQLRLEDRLPHLLNELELRAAELEDRRLTKEREQAERERRWRKAMQAAEQRLIADNRLQALREQVDAWEHADRIRAYCDAVEARHGDNARDGDTADWLALARTYADRLQQLPEPPADPEPTPDRLKPYLGGWSPYGPHH